MLRTTTALLLILAIACLAPRAAAGQGACKAPSADCAVVGEWDLSVSLGAGARSNPVAGAEDIPLVVVPQVSYYGRRFFLNNLDAGFTLHEGDEHTVNLIATPGYDRVFFVRDDLQNFFVTTASGALNAPVVAEYDVRPRRTTWLTGVEWLWGRGPIAAQLDALYEATGRHKGYEIRAAAAGPLLQTDHSIVLSAGFTWKSAELVRYYYGIDAFYEPGSALNPFIKLGYTRALSDRWSINAFVHYERLGDAVADSPLVAERDVTTFFAGATFKVL
jgi:outer membrane protein